MPLDLSSWKRALDSLERGIARSVAAPADDEFTDAVIQRFEYCYELSWKMLKRHLEQASPTRQAQISGHSSRTKWSGVMSIDLAAPHLQHLRRILEEHVADCEAWAFGSRIGTSAKPFSDLDLALVSPGGVSVRRLALLASAFEESDLPIRVDLLDWHAASPSFQERIAEHHEVVFRPKSLPRPAS